MGKESLPALLVGAVAKSAGDALSNFLTILASALEEAARCDHSITVRTPHVEVSVTPSRERDSIEAEEVIVE